MYILHEESCVMQVHLLRHKKQMISLFIHLLIDCLLMFYAKAATFQLYSGDEHEMGDKRGYNPSFRTPDSGLF